MKTTGSPRRTVLTLAAVAMVALALATPSKAGISYDGFASWQPTSALGTFDASGSDKLVVAVSGEHNFNQSGNGQINSVTYDGQALIKAVDVDPNSPYVAGSAHGDTATDIWYLDNPASFHTAGQLGASVSGNGNNYVFTAIGLSGTAPGVGAIAAAPGAATVDLTTTAPDSMVISVIGMGGGGNTASPLPGVTANSPAGAVTIDGLEAGSNWAGHAVARTDVSSPGLQTFSFNTTKDDVATIAAEFRAAGGPPPPPSASLTLGSRVLVSENNQNFNISVFDGKAGYDNTGTTQTNPPLVTGVFGDGTVEDYNFFHSPNDGIVSYAKGAAGLIPDATTTSGNINGSGENWSNVWTTSDPGTNFNTTKDFTNGSVPNTFARCADASGTIDISGLESGTVYFPHGTYINQWDLSLTMTGPGQPDLTANDAQTSNGPGTNFGWITDFNFSNPGLLYDTISYNYFNADRDGSRARFMGVILDGTAPANEIPEPVTIGLLGLAACGLGGYVRRRRTA